MPIQRTSAVPVTVQNAISLASRRTNASFDYLVNTARRESSFQTNAKSSSSSAAGLFQFVEGTWLKVVKEDGDRLGLANIAKNIHRTSSGKYYVPNRGQRREILNLRHDPETSALVAAAYTEHNERYVRKRIGRTPSDGELYLAHFLGPGSAAKMISLAQSRPDSPANRYFPAAAKSNKSIFYNNGQPRSLAEVQNILVSSHVSGQNSDVRQSSSGSFAFGVMGGLMGEMDGSSADYGRGKEGSAGIWGELTAPTGAQSSASSQKSTRAEQQASGAEAAKAERHRHAAQQYRTATKETSAPQASGSSWMKDAFGG